MATEDDAPTPAMRLSAWDQTAMRAYIRVALCFPLDGTDGALDAATAHLRGSLARLARQRPDFAGTLEVRAGGLVHLRVGGPASTIPFSVEHLDAGGAFPFASYGALRAAAFPPAAFVGAAFAPPCDVVQAAAAGARVPVAAVKAFAVPGGLLLGVFFCHATADGDCLRVFLECLAGQTRCRPVDGPATKTLHVPLANGVAGDGDDGGDGGSGDSLDALLARVPEYVLLDEPAGPTVPRLRAGGVPLPAIAKTGKVFVFSNARLRALRRALTQHGRGRGHGLAAPSNYTCLAALTWAHVARARLSDPVRYVEADSRDGTALLQTMVNWKSRAYAAVNPCYFGNATAVAVTRLPTARVAAAAAAAAAAESDKETATEALARLADAVEQTIAGVDEAYVRDRTALFSRVADPRRVGLRFDPRTPQDLGFNTWRHFGADTQWALPGVAAEAGADLGAGAGRRPDCIRRLQDEWNMSGALILPARAASTEHELLVTLPQTSMAVLCADAAWMQWVERVVG